MLLNSKESCIPLPSKCFGLGWGSVFGALGFRTVSSVGWGP